MRKFLKCLLISVLSLIGLASILYFLGPEKTYPQVNNSRIELDIQIEELPDYIKRSNKSVKTLKADNGSQLYWADSIGVKTDYVLLFLHGFSGTHHEANPMHKEFGQRYGMNTYLHRIVDHGISDPDAFKGLTPVDLIDSAKEGLAIAKLLGDKVVIMSCSTGGTYAAYLAHEDKDISHLIFLSPNFELHLSSAKLITGPWGQQLVDQLFGEHRKVKQTPQAAPYWQTEYHTDGVVALQGLIDQTMKSEVFQDIHQPTYIGCYYKDEDHQDFVVSVDAMRSFHQTISTPSEDKVFVEFPDVENHVIGSPIKSKDVESVVRSVMEFGDRYFTVKVN